MSEVIIIGLGQLGRVFAGGLLRAGCSVIPVNRGDDLFKGTLIFVSHDRQFVSSLATRILEITPEGVEFYMGDYDEYLQSKGLE